MTNRIHTPLSQRLKWARVSALPFVVWIGALALAMELWSAAPTRPAFTGLARAPETLLASPIEAHLADIHVTLHQQVRAGDLLASLDDAEVQASLDLARIELDQLAAEMSAREAEILVEQRTLEREERSRSLQLRSVASLEYPAEMRAFHADEFDLQRRRLETRLAITTSELETQRLLLRLERARNLAQRSIGTEADAEDIDAWIALERARSSDLRGLEEHLGVMLAEAIERRQTLEAGYRGHGDVPSSDPALEQRLAGWEASLAVQRQHIADWGRRREELELRAPHDGRVAVLHASAGQYLLAGAPILELIDSQVREIAMWVPEFSDSTHRRGDRWSISPLHAATDGLRVVCVVQSLAPRLEALPERLWRDPRIAEYGRVLRLGAAEHIDLLPGERVRIEPLIE